jgi:hypothetical protein
MGDRLLYKAEPKQILLHTATTPNVLYGGAAGGGKSEALRWHGILSCLSVPGLQVLLVRREYTELNRTHLLRIYEQVPQELATWKGTDQRLEFPERNGRISMMHFGHCRTDQDFRKHLSTEWELILVDEAGELTEYMLQLLPSRLRTTKRGLRCQYMLASNPGGEGHEYMYRRFIARDIGEDEDPVYDPDDYFFIPADWRDNPHIDQVAYEKRIMALPEYERRRFSGDWEIAPDRMFPTWRKAQHVYTEGEVRYRPWWPCFRSLDWGYAAPTSIAWWLIDDEGNLYRARELCVAELDPEEHVPLVREIDEELAATVLTHAQEDGIPFAGAPERPAYTVADPAIWDMAPRWVKGPGPRLSERYEEAGLRDLVPASNQRKPGWQKLREYLNPKTKPTLYAEERCRAFVRQMGMLRRDQTDPEDIERGQEDHAADEARYAVMSRPEPGFRPVDMPWEKFEPGSPSWHESRYIHQRKRKDAYINDPGLGPIRISKP